jgi:hypothetical protein
MKPPEQEIMSMLTFFYLLNLAQILTMISYHNIRSFYIQFIKKKNYRLDDNRSEESGGFILHYYNFLSYCSFYISLSAI